MRGELGRQLEKLQRQASAAQRYRELKSAERRLKGELAALRWQKQNTQMVALQKKQQASQHELNTLEDQQRGGETGLQTYRQQADDARAHHLITKGLLCVSVVVLDICCLVAGTVFISTR